MRSTDLRDLVTKYAVGGPARKQRRLKPGNERLHAAIKMAQAHLEKGDRQAAMTVIKSTPEAMAHPAIQRIMDKMRKTQPVHPQTGRPMAHPDVAQQAQAQGKVAGPGGPGSAPPQPAQPPQGMPVGGGAPPGFAKGGSVRKDVRRMLVKKGQTTSGPFSVPISGLTQNRVLNEENVGNLQQAIAGGKEMNPIVIDSGGNILDGNHRVEAAKRLGISNIDAHVIHDKDQPVGFADGGDVEGLAKAGALAQAQGAQNVASPSIMESLTSGIQKLARVDPQGSAVLRAHATALLRAHLRAAQALHKTTGDMTGYSSLGQHAAQLGDPMAAYSIMNELGSSGQPSPGASPQAMTPLALQAAQSAAGRTG